MNIRKLKNGNGLFNTDGKYFWSESLLRRMLKMEEVSAKRKKAGQKGSKKRWNKNEEENERIKKRNIKLFIAKDSKVIANAKKYNSKCYKNHSKLIAKNSKIKSKNKNKIKIKEIKSIYPSYHRVEKNKTLEEMMDEMEKMEFESIVEKSEVRLYGQDGSRLAEEIIEIMKEIYMNPVTRKKIIGINIYNIDYALKQFKIANSKGTIQIPKAYFKKCLLSAIDQTELSQQIDTNI